jgi:amino acid adenylation domain-containing protein
MTEPWNNTRRDYPLGRSPHEFIEEQAERTPEAPALIMGARRLSYAELNAKANRLAHFLHKQGLGPESLVGVYLDRCPEMVVSLLAILKAGAVYLPLDPAFPEQRIAFMLGDAEAPLVLTQESKKDKLPGTTTHAVLLDEEEVFLSFPSSNLQPVSAASRLAYVIYTSGSTGKPKGVMVPRSGLVNFLFSMAETPGFVSTDVLLAVTTISFDISILELLLPLTAGGQLVVADKEQASDTGQLKQLIDSHGVTVMQATPTTWRMLVESGWAGKSDLKILCGGEPLPSDLARQLLPRCQELWNMYGPTETTIWSSVQRITSADEVYVGPPLANTQFYVVDEKQQLLPPGTPGELLIGGDGVALGYLKRSELTAAKFTPDGFSGVAGARLYHTGDEVRLRQDGTLEFLGRMDHQVKLRGFRIELGEIESKLAQIEGIRQAVAVVREDRPGDKRLVGYYTGREGLTSDALRQALQGSLPEYMVPSAFMRLEQFPLTPNAKLDRKALPPPPRNRPLLAQDFIAPRTTLERRLADLWCELLMLDGIGIDDSFFDLGGTSLAAIRMVSLYQQRFGREIPPVKVFQYPTVSQLCRFLEESDSDSGLVKDAERRASARRVHHPADDPTSAAVAVVGMTGRFPGADDLDQLWENLCNSVESISFFKPEELGPGIEEYLRNDPDYVRARGIIDGAGLFDAAFFGIGSLEAQVMDPQQRVFLELAYHALENAGCDPSRYKGTIGVFAGIGDNHYYTTNLLTHPDLLAMAGKLTVEYGNEKDYIALRVAYLLDLRGPAISMNTACSTSLTTIDNAYNALLDFECDVALAGGIDISVPQKSGFLYQEGGTFTRDGHCRPFDADASGTMFCDGAGVVVLKRLADALADGDTIYAVVRGTARNNNGARPASFLAPSADGQAEVIAMAQARANVPVETIGYIEAHGTGTPVGDPIEFDALCKVFEAKTTRKQFCYIGSMKGNVGHPTNAAGVAGFIKAALTLHREEIPPMLHFKTPNPKIDFDNSPFMPADRLIPFPRGKEPRRSAVSSFGFGGTNVHMILEEAPERRPLTPPRPVQLMLLSARTPSALDAYANSLARHLEKAPESAFADTAFTLQVGRKQFAHRRFVVAGNPKEAVGLLHQPHPMRCGSKRCERRDPPVVFLFGGQGTQYVNMGQNLYQGEPLFRAIVDDCCECLKPHLGRDLRELLYPRSGDEETARQSLQDTFFTQPSIFVIEYALARLWQSFGVQPAVMVGHSIGEFVAATLAGVWDLPEVLRIVALRGQLMQSQPRGSMLSVGCSAERVEGMLPPSLQLASNNSPSLCVVSGPDADVASFAELLKGQDIVCRNLHTSHAFHSAMMDPIVEPLCAEVAKAHLRPPTRPIVSTVTGQPMTEREATDPGYWARHARATVQFSRAVRWLVERDHDLFLECGPRATSCTLVRQHFPGDRACAAVPSFTDTHENHAEWAALFFAVGSLWLNGVNLDWDAFYAQEERRRIPLPTYPFERQRYWVDPAVGVTRATTPATTSAATLEGGSVAVAPLVAVGGSALSLGSAALLERASVDKATAMPSPSTGTQGSVSRDTRRARLAARLVEILVPISGRDQSQISTSATFLEQGFDSLSLTQVAFAIRKEFGVRVSFSQLMKEFPSIDMLAAHLEQVVSPDLFADKAPAEPAVESPILVVPPQSSGVQTTKATLEEIVAEQARAISRLVSLLEKVGIESTRQPGSGADATTSMPEAGSSEQEKVIPPSGPLTVESTVPQRGMYFSSRLSDHLSACYNQSMTLRLKGTIDLPKLVRAVEQLAERHDALRASFDEAGAVMHIAPAQKLDVPVTDLSTISRPAAREARLQELLSRETSLPFVLPEGPLFRSQIILLGADCAAVVITGHHIICDGWSLDVLIHDLCAFYSEEVSGEPARLHPVESYASYVRAYTQRVNSEEFKEARDYWHNKFAAGLQALVLPTDRARPARRNLAARRIDRSIPAPLVQGMRALGVKQGCSFFAVVAGAVSILMARISRQRRFVIALPTADQPVIGQPDLVGHCVSLLPLGVDLVEGEAISTFLSRVQHELAAAQDHSAFTLVSLLEELRPVTPVRGVSPVSAGLTNVKKYRPHELPQFGFSADYDMNPMSFQSFEWYLNATEVGDALELKCHYDTELFKSSTVQTWLGTFAEILRDMVADPSRVAMELAGLKGEVESPGTSALYALGAKEKIDKNLLPRAPVLAGEREAPRTETERALAGIWQEVLGVREIGIHEDFFELGGQSLLAVAVQAKVERAFGKRLPLAALIEAPTVHQFSELVGDNHATPCWSSLVPLRASGSKPPLFLMHSHGGNVLEYHPLARHLAKDQPVYALQARGLDGSMVEEPRIEEMASYYLREMRSVQPHGPYYLGGFCFGGLIALEAAQQLCAQGEAVGLLVMINAPTPEYTNRQATTSLPHRLVYRSAYRLALEWANLSGRPLRGILAHVWARGRRARDLSQARAEMRLESVLGRWPRRISKHSMTYQLERLATAHDRAGAAYKPSHYDGKVIQLYAKRQPFGLPTDPALGWRGLFNGEFRVQEVPGFRQTMLDEANVATLASVITNSLRACEERREDQEDRRETCARASA